MKHVFIIGSKGIPAQYGGFETFADKLIEYKKSKEIQYYIACAEDDLSNLPQQFEHNGAHCFRIKWRKLGAAKAIFYDLDALVWSLRYCEKNQIDKPIFYILACRIGPFMAHYKRKIKQYSGTLFVNPDGHEWMRAKWILPIRKYWKFSERLMVKHADCLICDSKNIERYIKDTYSKYRPNTRYIAYGAESRE